ncbi:DUF1187 family protein [Escherichia coli]|nr:DUF1187 family protein [Escherichia coli]EIG8523218.1 DUF1187 family protein [Escherichia coli]
MYKITATIEKEGGTPTNWTRYSKSKLTKSECEKMLSGKKEAGVSREQKVKLINFNCEKTSVLVSCIIYKLKLHS